MKAQLAQAGITQAALARSLGLPRSTVVTVINHGARSAAEHKALAAITQELRRRGVRPAEEPKPRANAAPAAQQSHSSQQEPHMIRKHTISPATRAHFGLVRDPFLPPEDPADVYISPAYRYVREAMISKAQYGGLLCVVGESGGGKSTLRELVLDAWGRDGQTIAILPYVLSSSQTEATGRPLRATNILEAILAAIAPSAALRRTPDARMRQVHEALRVSARAGHRHVLIIEEAHDLATSTLRAIKRVVELKDGLRSLISVVIVAQPEITKRLVETNAELREIVQRMEMVHVPPLDTDLEGFLRHRFQRIGADLGKVLEPAALDAIRTRLQPRGRESMLYPLAVQNLLAAAMNACAELGAPKVTAQAISEVAR